MAMDPDLAAALERVTKAIEHSDKTVGAVQRELSELRSDVGERFEKIERHVGLGPSDPPPPRRLAALASSSALEVDALKAEVIQLREEQQANHTAVRAELAKQSTAMGIGVKGLKWITSAEGRAVVIRLAQLAALAYLSFLAYTHGTPPPPVAPQLPQPAESR